jgi:hypothetical protein
MRINVYSQELTNEIQVITKEADTGVVYSAVRLMLHSPDLLHHTADDDDRSGITFWLPKSSSRRTEFANTLRDMADAVEAAQPETGLD